jgi:hypothetical protein
MNKRLNALSPDTSGVAMVEFALILPVLLTLGLGSVELANVVIAHRAISDITMSVSDNASRMGAQTTLSNKPVSEREINDVFIGAKLQGGKIDIKKNGRIILSSVQLNEQGGQTIKWQRCYGDKVFASSFGSQGLGATGTAITSVGPSGGVTARPGTAVMLVQVAYDYKPIVEVGPLGSKVITETAAFNVRDSRDLSAIYNPDGDTVSNCS